MTTCRHCGWELPAGALFCGECGRAVTPAAAEPAGEAVVPETAVPEAAAPEAETAVPDSEPGGEGPSLDRFGREWDSWASETWVDRPAAPEPPAEQSVEQPPPASASADAEQPSAASVDAESVDAPADASATAALDLSLFEPTTPGREPTPPLQPRAQDAPRIPTPPLLPVPELPAADRGSTRPDPDEAAIDLESTRLVSRSPHSRHVLQFSTGESVTVAGSGLVGRNPAMEPGEYVDQLVTLVDGGRSVSKTHLEFGQEQGRFWVSDRYSTNGTVVRPPDEAERRCEPGRRYLVSRGTRVDIGEQFFVVS